VETVVSIEQAVGWDIRLLMGAGERRKVSAHMIFLLQSPIT
jgi:hypothetical protein